MNRAKLVLNESYWDLFLNRQTQEQEFLALDSLDINKIKKMGISEVTHLIALTLKKKDKNITAKYCIEIKTNGSSRSARIPLVRFSSQNQSIWKIVRSLKELDGGILDLQDLEYHLTQSLGERKFPMPRKVLVILEDESEKMGKTDVLEYVKNKSVGANVLCISLKFLRGYLSLETAADIEKIMADKQTVYLEFE